MNIILFNELLEEKVISQKEIIKYLKRRIEEKSQDSHDHWKAESDLWQEQYEMLDYYSNTLISDLADQLIDYDVQRETIEMLEKQRNENLLESKKDNYDNGMEINRLKTEVKELKEDNESLSDELIETAKDMNDLWAEYAEEVFKLKEENKALKNQLNQTGKKNENTTIQTKNTENENKTEEKKTKSPEKAENREMDVFKTTKDRLCNKNYKLEKSESGFTAKKKGCRNIEIKSGPLPGSIMYVVCDRKVYDLSAALKA
ncbi:hypothetical protein Q5O14_07765 [Eubacteriaceae bacterium ES2]|nr:hypothetical protein Q5O14_07765 [Eubacteriaceae bacterium ES2]